MGSSAAHQAKRLLNSLARAGLSWDEAFDLFTFLSVAGISGLPETA